MLKPKQVRDLADFLNKKLDNFGAIDCPEHQTMITWIASWVRETEEQELNKNFNKAVNFSEMLR